MASWTLANEHNNMNVGDRASWQHFILAVTITLDTIWLTRNKCVREGLEPDLMDLIRYVHRRSIAHKAAWSDQVSYLSKWQLPTEGVIKINFDVAVGQNHLYAAAVSRNSEGMIMKIHICQTPGRDKWQNQD